MEEIPNNHRLDGVLYPINNGISTTIPSTGEFTGFLKRINRYVLGTFSIRISRRIEQIQSPQGYESGTRVGEFV